MTPIMQDNYIKWKENLSRTTISLYNAPHSTEELKCLQNYTCLEAVSCWQNRSGRPLLCRTTHQPQEVRKPEQRTSARNTHSNRRYQRQFKKTYTALILSLLQYLPFGFNVI